MDDRNDKIRIEMRKRGWSMHSEASAKSEQDMTEAQKKELLENFPRHLDDNDNGDGESESKESKGPARKKVKLAVVEAAVATTTPFKDTKVSPELMEHAKAKLSKWAARLFDPNRPRGLVQAPQIIPLNDEFLTAFGQRERDFDVKLGRTMSIDRAVGQPKDDDGGAVTTSSKTVGDVATDFGKLEGRKIKVANLGYTTTEQALAKACAKFGPLAHCKMLMDKTNTARNAGRAFVTFERSEDAEACRKRLMHLEGRSLTLTMAEALPPRVKSAHSGPSRYWERDISTKCFRCCQVGHMSAQCPNSKKLKSCPLCGKDDHDVRDCHYNRICFKCGLPGHINRECRQPQVPGGKRLVCGICFGSGHHRIQCRRGPFDAPDVSQAKCMVCNKEGHFMCREMKWFFGLDGISCFNCGRENHHGYDCDRPPLTVCARDEGVTRMELDRAAAVQLSDELEQQKQRGRQRSRGEDRNTYRPKSQPPPQNREYGGGQRNNNHGYNNGGGGRGDSRNNNNSRGYSASPGGRGGGSFQRRNDNRGYGNR